MKYDFDEIIERRNTNCMKWDGEEFVRDVGVEAHFDDDTISVFTADMDFRCPEPVIKAVTEVAQFGVYGYPYIDSNNKYYDSVIRWFSKYGWNIKKSELLSMQGTLGGISTAIRTFTDIGERVIILTPVYGVFQFTIRSAGRDIVMCHLKRDDKEYYTIDFGELERLAKDEKNTALLFCNPHNPVGRVWTENELKKVVEICKKYDLLLISDEVHCDLTRIGISYNPMGKYTDGHAKSLIFTAPNKTFNVAGFQVCNVVVPDEQVCAKFKQEVGFSHISQFGAAACEAAYNEGEEWLEQLREYLDDTIDWALQYMRNRMPKVKCGRPEATYCLWMDFSEYHYEMEELVDRISNKANVILEEGFMFDPDQGHQFMRICVPSSRKVIQEAFERIAKALD